MYNVNSLKKIKIFTILLSIIFLFSLSPQKPEAIFGLEKFSGFPYGGIVVFNLWCYGGFLTYITVTNDSLIQGWGGDYRKYYYTPARFGQNVVGKGLFYAPCFVPAPWGAQYIDSGIYTYVQGQSM